MTTTEPQTTTAAAESLLAEGQAPTGEEIITVPRRFPLSLRIVRTSVLDELRADIAQADQDVKAYEAVADQWAEAYESEALLTNDAEQRADEAEDRAERLTATLDTELVTSAELRAAGRQMADILSDGETRIDDAIRKIAAVLISHADAFGLDAERIRCGGQQISEQADVMFEGLRSVIGQADRARDAARAERDQARGLLAAAYRYPHDSTQPAILGDHLGINGCEACAASLREVSDETLLAAHEAAVSLGNGAADEMIRAEARRRQPTFSTLVMVLAQMQREDASKGADQ